MQKNLLLLKRNPKEVFRVKIEDISFPAYGRLGRKSTVCQLHMKDGRIIELSDRVKWIEDYVMDNLLPDIDKER